MLIRLENYNDVILYTLENLISYARYYQYIFVAQYVWWLASIIDHKLELVKYIDTLQIQQHTATVTIG